MLLSVACTGDASRPVPRSPVVAPALSMPPADALHAWNDGTRSLPPLPVPAALAASRDAAWQALADRVRAGRSPTDADALVRAYLCRWSPPMLGAEGR